MRKLTALLLALTLAFTSVACTAPEDEHTLFYYLRSEETILYGEPDGLIAPLSRELTGSGQLDTTLQLYMEGPNEENFRSPFPKGTYLLSTIQRDDMLVVVLSREFSTLSGIHLTLAGACLTATCHDLTGLTRVQVRSGEHIYDFNLNDFVFLDDSAGT